MSQKLSKTKLIQDNRLLRKYTDILEQELKQGTLNESEISLFDDQTIRDYNCYKKCGGKFEYIPKENRYDDKPYRCNRCHRPKNFNQIKTLGHKITLIENPMKSIQESIDFHISMKIESLEYFRQTLAKIYRAITDDITEQETAENIQKAKEIKSKIFSYNGITKDLHKTRIMSLITTDGTFEQVGEFKLKLNRTNRIKKIDEIKYNQITSEFTIDNILNNQFSIKNLLNIVNIPEQKIRKNIEKSENEIRNQIIKTDINISKEDQKLRDDLEAKKRLAEIHEKNRIQKLEHEQKCKTDPFYNLRHCKSHKPYLDFVDDETKNPDEFNTLRFYKSDHDKFYIPLIKKNWYDYTEIGMKSRMILIINFKKFNPELVN